MMIWNDIESRVPDDIMPLAGEVIGSNRRRSNAPSFANIVYEKVEGRLVWRLYYFRAGLVRHYKYGPHDREHGLERGFFEDRTSAHSWFGLSFMSGLCVKSL